MARLALTTRNRKSYIKVIPFWKNLYKVPKRRDGKGSGSVSRSLAFMCGRGQAPTRANIVNSSLQLKPWNGRGNVVVRC